MKKYFSWFIAIGLYFLCYSALLFYFFNKHLNLWWSFELRYSRMIAISCINILFLALMFLIDFEIFKRIFKLIIILSIGLWGFIHTHSILKLEPLPLYFWNIWDIFIFLAWAILAPGLILYIIYYIRNSTAKYADAKVFGKYHLHEGFVGIILIIGAIPLFLLRLVLIPHDIFLRELGFIMAIIQIFLFLFLYIGTFLIIRDWDDVIHFKFLEIKDHAKSRNDTTQKVEIFNLITEDDLHFFKISKMVYYPFGILLTSFAINAIVFGNGFLPIELFHLANESVIRFGYICCIIAGGLLGKDWFRIFKRFYPELYGEIVQVLEDLRNLKS